MHGSVTSAGSAVFQWDYQGNGGFQCLEGAENACHVRCYLKGEVTTEFKAFEYTVIPGG